MRVTVIIVLMFVTVMIMGVKYAQDWTPFATGTYPLPEVGRRSVVAQIDGGGARIGDPMIEDHELSAG